MAPKKPDRRVQRTRRLLHQALLSLVVERGYASTTVQDILDRAEVGRSTFYAHFRDKDDLLLSGMQPLQEALMRSLVPAPGAMPEPLGFSESFFRHGEAYREAYKALAGSRSRTIADQKLSRMITDLVAADLKRRTPSRKAAVPPDAAAYGVAGALMGLVAWWIQQKVPVPPEEVNRIFLQLMRPGVEAAFR